MTLAFPSEHSIRQSFRAQGQLAQTHRWLACQYANSAAPGAEFLAADATFELNGSTCAREQMRSSITRHDIGRFVFENDASTHLNPVAAQSEENTLQLTFGKDNVISGIHLVLGEEKGSRAEPLSPVPHRILSLKHRWHQIVESPVKQPEGFKDIIASDFSMDWGYGSLTGLPALSEWLTGSAASVSAARHDIRSFAWESNDTHRYEATFEFDWYGFSLEDEPMFAQSRHQWRLVDDLSERFPRLVRMQVELTNPFHVVAKEES